MNKEIDARIYHRPSAEYARILAKASGLSMTELALRLGITRSQMHNYTSGRVPMSYVVQVTLEMLAVGNHPRYLASEKANPP